MHMVYKGLKSNSINQRNAECSGIGDIIRTLCDFPYGEFFLLIFSGFSPTWPSGLMFSIGKNVRLFVCMFGISLIYRILFENFVDRMHKFMQCLYLYKK